MAEKEIHSSRPCPVCLKPSYAQFDKGGKLFTMCDGRHPDNSGCGVRIYFGPRNSATIKAAKAQGKAPQHVTAKTQNDNTPSAQNDNAETGKSGPAAGRAGDGAGSAKPGDGWGVNGDW